MQSIARSYRCHYTPLDRDGFPVPSESGVLPFIQIKAESAEDALKKAFAIKCCPIAEVERLEAADFTPPSDSVFAVLSDAHERAQSGRFAA